MQQGITHILGAGLAGLSAATFLAERGRRVIVYEAAGHAGGRCRSYHDTQLDAVIDNGNHLLLSGNKAALSYLKRIGSEAFNCKGNAVFHFVDARTNQRWALDINKGRIPFWLLFPSRRVPGTRIRDYLSILPLLRADKYQTVTQLMDSQQPLFRKLWHLLLLSALNTDPHEASAQLAASVLRGTLLKGGSACVPLVSEGLSAAFIDPAVSYLKAHGGDIVFNRRVSDITYSNGRAALLAFAMGEPVEIGVDDRVICALPAWNIAPLMPQIEAPDSWRPIVNAHFTIAPPRDFPAIMAVLNATVEWVFVFNNRISITISDAGRLLQDDRETLAQQLWQEVAAITGLAATLPPWQIVREKRATFAATPTQDARRPGTKTPWPNVFLAGDWIQTGLPATMEGAILSGTKAAEMSMVTQ